ncbi:MAG: hypothetical protein MJ086_03510 [Lachnospiraceae bacterium]|nr:hypothetical protein [Lachnospiraceae bacterium]
MYIIRTEKGFYKDWNYGKCEFTQDKKEAKQYSQKFWAERVIQMNWMRGARVEKLED